MQMEPQLDPQTDPQTGPQIGPGPVPADVVEFVEVVEVEVEVGPDRDLVTLEALEAELAVLEDELARVDAGRDVADPAPAPGVQP